MNATIVREERRTNPFERKNIRARIRICPNCGGAEVVEIIGKGTAEWQCMSCGYAVEESETFLLRSAQDKFFFGSGAGGMERVSVRTRNGMTETEVFKDGAYAQYL